MTNDNNGLALVTPQVMPPLDASFRPAVLANRAFRQLLQLSGQNVPVRLALEQSDGTVSHFHTELFPHQHPQAAGNFTYLERITKFLLWSRGGFRIHFAGPAELAARLMGYYRESTTGRFDSNIVAERMFDQPLEVLHVTELPPERHAGTSLGRHLEGCRIGFDLGGSDRKAAALIDGKVVYSEETIWDPYFQPDPQYHFEGIMDSLRNAAAQLPRVDAIGGSAAGIYVNNRVKVASLFRGVAPKDFEARVKDMFLEIQREWNIPFEVVNDGEVTALAGSMSLGRNRVLGISFGTSVAGGYVNAQGNLTSWINELAFVPIDYNPQAPVDEWSGDYGCTVQYFSQQAVGRLLAPAGITEADPELPLPEKLKLVQQLMRQGDPRARSIYETIGTYLGYGVAHFADFYDLENVLILGRVTSGQGGDVILGTAREVLRKEFPELANGITMSTPGEHDKRHGQAIAAASLPALHSNQQ